jgi:FtsZ-binding cell division protein ZapB
MAESADNTNKATPNEPTSAQPNPIVAKPNEAKPAEVKPVTPVTTQPPKSDSVNPLLKQNEELRKSNELLKAEVEDLTKRNQSISKDLVDTAMTLERLNDHCAKLNDNQNALESKLQQNPFITFPSYTVRQILKDGGMDSQMTEKSLQKLMELFKLS